MVNRLQGAVPTLFPTLAPTIARQKRGEDGIQGRPVLQGSKTMLNSRSHSQLACALGALAFAGLSFGAALFPLIVA